MPENLGVDFSQHDDHAKNQGIDPDILQTCTEKNGIEDSDKGNSISIEDVDNGNSIPIVVDKEVGISNSNSEMTWVVHIDGLSGLSRPKQKSSWTRITRMDFGLGSFTREIEGPLLGKRVSAQNTNLSLPREDEEA